MILGLSHVGLSVKDLDASVQYYQETFGFQVLSDAERKGEWIARITGIPNFHTRTVYLSVAPHMHLELFGFYSPRVVPAEKASLPRVGISYCTFIAKDLNNLTHLVKVAKDQDPADSIWNTVAELYEEGQIVSLLDPNQLTLRIIEVKDEGSASHALFERITLCPAIVVQDVEASLRFYRDILGLEIGRQAKPRKEPIHWVLLEGPSGICLQLIQPLNTDVLPAGPWRMEQIGFTHIALAVKNLEKLYEELTGRGVRFKSSPQAVTVGPHEGGKIVYFTTPEGIVLEFIDSPLTLEYPMEI